MNFRNTLIAATLVFAHFLANAQNVQQKDNIKKGKDVLKGYVATYKYKKKLAQQTLNQKIKDAHLKASSHKKRFYTFKGVVWPEISPLKLDYYYKLSGKKKTTLYFVASKGYDNYVLPSNDSTTANAIMRYLQDLDERIRITGEINDKQKELDKLENKADKTEKNKQQKQEQLDALKKQQ